MVRHKRSHRLTQFLYGWPSENLVLMKRKLSLAWMVVEPRRCRAVMVDQVKQGAQHFGAPAFDAQHFGAVHFGAPQFMHLHFVFHPQQVLKQLYVTCMKCQTVKCGYQ